ncbi:MAG: right-handed parallel beta-helix repeat-containing protein [Chloroflexi bacterium]|nr:right-handed parallel beta-helix repeat-containing protein [Chloroflexota bacterium]
MLLFVLVFAWSLVGMNPTAAQAAVATYYVDNTNALCNDLGAGSEAVPYCSLTKAASMAGPGDTVRVLPGGTYAETVYPASGTVGNPVTFHAEAATPTKSAATITGSVPGFGSAFAVSARTYVVIDGFNITGTHNKGIYVDASEHITISNNHVSYAGDPADPSLHVQGIYLKGTTYSTITGNTTDHNTCIGIRLVNGSDYNTVSDNVSFANASVVVSDAAGIELTGASHNTIINNITYGNEDSGINLYVNSSGVASTYNVVVGNLSYGNGDHGIDNNNSPYNTVIGNTVQGNGTVGINFEGEVTLGSHHATVANNISVGNGLTPPSGSFGGNLRVDTPSIVGTTLDYDLFDRQGASVQIIWNNASYTSLAAFRAAVPSQEVHGLEGNPRFVSPVTPVLRTSGVVFAASTTTGDYRITDGSPAIDSANADAPYEPSIDIEGHARVDDPATADSGAGARTYDDRGAYEFQPSGLVALPVVSTQAVTTIEVASAIGNGTIVSLGIPDPYEHGVVWSTLANPTIADNKTTEGPLSATGAFTSSIVGLAPSTLYHVRAYATNTTGTAYGEDVSFTTLSASGNTGFIFANATVSSSSVSNPDRGWTSNDQYATFNSSDWAEYGFPSLGIPADATIDGIQVAVEGQRNGTMQNRDFTVALWNTSALNPDAYTASKTAGMSNNDTTPILGTATDKWGTTWTPADFADATFKVRVGTSGSWGDADLDAISIKVYYTLPYRRTTTTSVNCGAGTPTTTYGTGISCVATVVRSGGSNTPTGNVNWATNGSGSFATSPCTLSGSGGTATCSVTYTPSAVGTGSHLITASYAGDTNFFASSGTQTVTVAPKAASVTPDIATKVYGDADPILTGTLTGFLPADGVTATYSRIAGETVLGGPYAISATLAPTEVLVNYTITYATADFTITPKAASVTPNAATKVYGEADPILTGTLDGFLPADGVTATYSRIAGETVLGGPYAISATLDPAAVLSNYTITYNTADFTITAKAASVTPDALSKVYGEADPILTGTLDGFLPADSVTATYARVAGETVLGGPYAISATLAPAGVLSNYTVTYNTADFTITLKAASVTPNAAGKVYGELDPTLTGTLTGFLPADGVTAVFIRAAGETVLGGPYAISAVLDPLGVLSNYDITYNTANFTITPKAASVTPDALSKVYGEADPTLTGALTGFLPADGVTATYARVAGETVLGGPYAISATLAPDGVLSNYALTYNTANFTITPKAASVTPDAFSKVYGDADPTLTGTLTGFLPADGVTATYARVAGETVLGGPYAISAVLDPAGVLSNYAITYNTADFTITAKAASVIPDAASKVYGAADPTFSGTLSGFLPADGVTATYARAAGETVLGGPYAISAVLDPAGVLSNYAITYNTADFTIIPKTASVTPDAAGKVYGDADPILTGTLTGFLPADGVTATYARVAGETVLGGPYTISAALDPAGVLSNYTITYNTADFTITPKNASVTPTVAGKVYGDADPTLDGTLTGFLPADGVTAAYSRAAGENAGDYPISAVLAPTGVLSNYTITYTPVDFTIAPKPASVTPSAAAKTYGATDPILGGALSGFLPADGVTATYSRTAGENAGAYPISATLAPAGVLSNYAITYHTADFTINPAALTVTAVTDSKVYDGTIASDGVPTITSGALVGDDTAAWTQTFDTRHVASGKTLTPAGAINDDNGGNNYIVTFVAVHNGSITKLGITVTAVTDSKVYDGTTASAAKPTVAPALVGGDTEGFSQAFADKNAATGKTLTPSGSVDDGNGGLNYDVTFVSVNTGTISKLGITVTAVTDSKVYDGTSVSAAEPTITPALVGADTEAFSQAFDTRNVGTGKTLTASGLVDDGNGGNNYLVSFVAVTDGEITVRAMAVTAASDTKVYDGNASSAALPTITSGSLAVGDTANWTQSFNDKNAGVGKVLTPIGSIDDGNGGANYDISFITALGAITPADLHVTANNKIVFVGSPDPLFDYSVSGFIAPDDFIAAPTCLVADPHTDVGTYPIVCSGGDAGSNYTIVYHNGLFTVTAKIILDVTAPSPSIVYGGALPTLTPTITGFVSDDDISDLDTAPTCTAGAGPFTVVGSPYPVTCSGGVDDKYEFNYISGLLTVEPKALTITANNASKTYGDIATFTGAEFVVTGLIGSDTVSSVTLTSDGAPATAAVGPYTIVPSTALGTGLGNYTITYANGTLTVNARSLTITANNASKTYGAVKTFAGTEFTVLGLVNADAVASVTLTSNGAAATASVGTYPIAPSAALGTGLGNYTISYANGTLAVNKAALTVTAVSQTKAFGASDPAFIFTLTGLQNGETAAVIDTAPTCGVSVAHGSPGTYPIVCSGGLDNNYDFTTYVDGILTVSGVNSATFADVPMSHWAWKYVESLYAFKITGGCGASPLIYCPVKAVTRDQMAVFLLKAKHGADYNPPAVGTSTGFSDVPITHWAAAWIKQLAAEGVTGGCGGGKYCPATVVTRDQMAVFLLRTKYGNTYTPPPVGTSTGFNDVPVTYWAAAWIKQLAAEGVTGGCGGGNYCPSTSVTRDQMSVFLVKTFDLPTP